MYSYFYREFFNQCQINYSLQNTVGLDNFGLAGID